MVLIYISNPGIAGSTLAHTVFCGQASRHVYSKSLVLQHVWGLLPELISRITVVSLEAPE